LKKSLFSISLITALIGAFVSPLGVGAAATPTPTWNIYWDSEPVAGEPSPAFTFVMSGAVPLEDKTFHKVQLSVYDEVNVASWTRASGSECSTASECGILSVTYDGSPIDYTVNSYLSRTRFLFTFTRGDVEESGVTAPGILDSGLELVLRVDAGQFTVPSAPFSGKPLVYVNTAFWQSPFGVVGGLHSLPNSGLGTESVGAWSSSEDLSTGGSAPSPVMAAIDVNPTNITVESEIITILGANLDTVTDVFIGGVRVTIFTQSSNRLQIRAPKGLSGLVDLELKSSLNDVLMTKKLNFGGTVAAAGQQKRTLVVGGFAPNSRKLTARMKSRIDRWLEKNAALGTLTCTGFTSLPRRTTDMTLSTKRGLTACNYSKKQRSDIETSVSQGIEDPRPGPNVRRVRLVLTP
jgi:hypothetical protein